MAIVVTVVRPHGCKTVMSKTNSKTVQDQQWDRTFQDHAQEQDHKPKPQPTYMHSNS